jgi:hypothetical protein
MRVTLLQVSTLLGEVRARAHCVGSAGPRQSCSGHTSSPLSSFPHFQRRHRLGAGSPIGCRGKWSIGCHGLPTRPARCRWLPWTARMAWAEVPMARWSRWTTTTLLVTRSGMTGSHRLGADRRALVPSARLIADTASSLPPVTTSAPSSPMPLGPSATDATSGCRQTPTRTGRAVQGRSPGGSPIGRARPGSTA